MITYQNAIKKAQLIEQGTIYVPTEIAQAIIFNKSTAGPTTSTHCLTLQWESHRIKLEAIKDQNSTFSLHKNNDKYAIKKNNEYFLSDVDLCANPFHAPDQIFLNLGDRCIYNCAFCTLARSTKGTLHLHHSKERFRDLILQGITRHQLNSVALTSGIYPSNEDIIAAMCFIIKQVKKEYPSVSFGVEPCIFTIDDIKALKDAGADEMKLNIQIPDKDMFTFLSPDFAYDTLLELLEKAVHVFGKGKVTSNIIFGLGETDESVIAMIEHLAQKGVVPTLRKIRINVGNKKEIEKRLQKNIPNVSAERIECLAKKHKDILRKYNLTTASFQTMCHACGCCDLVPFWDI